jgi:hypothetical protein
MRTKLSPRSEVRYRHRNFGCVDGLNEENLRSSHHEEGMMKSGATTTTGTVVRILPKTFYDFLRLKASTTMTLRLASKIDVSVFTEAEWILRLHAATFSGTSQIQFTSIFDGYDFADPALVFTQNGTTATFAAANVPPAYTVLPIGTNFGRLLTLDMTATAPASGAFNVTISVDLVLKGGDPRDMVDVANFYRGYGVQ